MSTGIFYLNDMNTFYQSEQEIDTLVTAFSDKTLDKSLWTHAAHLTVAIWHLKNYDLHEATCRMKSAIISYNLSVGGQNTGTGGYHETMTLFWMDMLHLFVKMNPGLPVKDTCNNLLESEWSDKALPFRFYSKDRIMSPEARSRAVGPDLQQLGMV